MVVTTYAQNFEDVMLWRALQHVPCGFYIDVGAQDPVLDSVSRHFYEAGWRGIHVEPNPVYAGQLRAARPGDTVIEAVVGDQPGLVRFFTFADTGLSTAVDEVADQHRVNGYAASEITAPCITLDMLFEQCRGQDVHWLKLDVEGFEARVIAGWQRSPARPWIIVVEAIAPGRRDSTADSYAEAVCAKGYHLAYFDGLNQFYVSDLHCELDQHFAFGPCLWDEIQAPIESRMVQCVKRENEEALALLRSESAAEKVAFHQTMQRSEQRIDSLLLAEAELITQLSSASARGDRLDAELGRLREQLASTAGLVERLVGSLEAIASGARGAARRMALDSLSRRPRLERSLGLAETATARSVDELLLIGNAVFLDATYVTLLGRPADQAGRKHYLTQLAAGVSREAIIAEIARSAEAANHAAALPGLSRLCGQQRWLMWPVVRQVAQAVRRLTAYGATFVSGTPGAAGATCEHNLRDLLAEPARFLEQAYEFVLGRAPDPAGQAHYQARLVSGDEPLAILAELYWSAEGQAGRLDHPDLRQAVAWYPTRNWWVVGRFRRARAIKRWMPSRAERLTGLLRALDRAEIEHKAARPQGLPRMTVSGHGESAKLLADELSHLEALAEAPFRATLTVGTGNEPPTDSTIWYAPSDAAQALPITPVLPGSLRAIAVADKQSAKNLVDRGVGVAVQAVGPAIPGASGYCAMRLMHLAAGLESRRAKAFDASTTSLRVAVLTTWNTRCGIATHSEELLEDWPSRDITILAPIQEDLLAADGPNVKRLWYADKQRSGLDRVASHLRREPVDLLLIQFNFGFYNNAELSDFLIEVRRSGICTIVICHSTDQPFDLPGWRLGELLAGFASAGRVIVHNPIDFERLQGAGLTDNILRVPHGVRPGRPVVRRCPPSEAPVLGTFGFCLPNKGLVEIVEALAILREGGLAVRLRMFNALHPDPSSAQVAGQVKDRIAALKLNDAVEFITDFLDMDTIDRQIASVDLAVNPYQRTGESASGAVRISLRNKVPTLVTPLPIFDDLGELVFRAPGVRPQDLAEGLRAALTELSDASAADARQALCDEWLGEHLFSGQADRLSRICRTLQANAILGGN